MNFKTRSRALVTLINREIWAVTALEDRTLKGKLYGLLRVGSLIGHGLLQNKLPLQSAALSYYSLMALGPLAALAIMVSSFIVRDESGNLAESALRKALVVIAAPASLRVDTERLPLLTPTPEAEEEEELVNPDLVHLVNNIVGSARSGAVGVVGTLILILISIQLLVSIEKSFNGIWGVRRGRTLVQRVFFYWTLITLGAVLGLASFTLFSVAALARLFDNIPYLGGMLLNLILWGAPVLSVLLASLLLAVFYRFMPNTHVQWKGALTGALLVVLLLTANNELSFLYIQRVISTKSLYGSVGIVPLLMFGLFVFWLFVLLGAQVSYAVQNVNTLTNQRAWKDISFRTREAIALAALVLVSRRFQDAQLPLSGEELSQRLRVPSQVLNECLGQLCESHLLHTVEINEDDAHEQTVRYQPGRPLSSITLGLFKQTIETFGNNSGLALIRDIDPLVSHYEDKLDAYYEEAFLSLEEVLKKHPPAARG